MLLGLKGVHGDVVLLHVQFALGALEQHLLGLLHVDEARLVGVEFLAGDEVADPLFGLGGPQAPALLLQQSEVLQEVFLEHNEVEGGFAHEVALDGVVAVILHAFVEVD